MSSQVFSVHPRNHRCFLYKGQPFRVLTSAEHYGAVMNADFDYDLYLQELRRTGENMTRVFAFFREMHPSVCTGEADTLGPRPEAVVSPWLRVPGHGPAADGLDRFDLDQWDPAYFARLRDFAAKCARQGVVCEITLFGNPYDWPRWDLCPCSAASNINGVGSGITHPYDAMTLTDPTVVAFQERFVRKMAQELNDLDNIYYEICNEPHYNSDPTAARERQIVAWHAHLARTLREAEHGLPNRHLIAANAHFRLKVPAAPGGPDTRLEDLAHFEDPEIDIVNYHYISTRAQAEGLHFVDLSKDKANARAGVIWRFLRQRDGYHKPMVFDETFSGIIGGMPEWYPINRAEAWETLLSGGAGYDNLDWSFTVADATGSGAVPLPDGRQLDGRCLRDWYAILRGLLAGYDLAALQPAPEVLPPSTPGYALVASGDGQGRYILYLVDQGVYERRPCPPREVRLALSLPPGTYTVRTLDPRTGAGATAGTLSAGAAMLQVTCEEDLAILLDRVGV